MSKKSCDNCACWAVCKFRAPITHAVLQTQEGKNSLEAISGEVADDGNRLFLDIKAAVERAVADKCSSWRETA